MSLTEYTVKARSLTIGVLLTDSQAGVDRTAAALGRNPVDDLIRIHDVARLAVHAVGEIDLQALAGVGKAAVAEGRAAGGSRHHLVHGSRTEVLARVAKLGG